MRGYAEDTGSMTDWRLFFLVALPLFVTFFSTADRSLPYHIDPFTNVISASTLGTTGSPILDEYASLAEPERFSIFAWVVDSPRGPVSQYPPGTAILAAPFYTLAGPGEIIPLYAYNDLDAAPIQMRVPPFWPAAFVSSLTTALALAFSALSVRNATGSAHWATITAIVLAGGTGIWLNGAFQLWQHGPASMWIAASVWTASQAKWSHSGLLAGLAVLTRPPVAIIAAGVGLVTAYRQRSWLPALKVGLGSSVGLAVLLSYNYWLYDTVTVSGGYGSGFTDNLFEAESWWYVRNLFGAFFSFDRGLFVWSPIVALAVIGAGLVVKRTPPWAVGALAGSVVLLLVQFRLNRYSGGGGFSSYRYPLEALVASTPALALGAKQIWESTPLRLLLPIAALASIGNHALALIRTLT